MIRTVAQSQLHELNKRNQQRKILFISLAMQKTPLRTYQKFNAPYFKNEDFSIHFTKRKSKNALQLIIKNKND
jgi:hypothetical protein